MHSMTGYASKTFDFADYSVTVEIKSLNNKFLEFRCRLPPALDHLEERFRQIIRGYVQRGKVDVFVKLVAREERELRIIKRMIAKYYGILTRIEQETGYGFQVSLSEIVTMKNLINPFEEIAYTDVPDELIEKVFTETVEIFQRTRSIEGENTGKDLLAYVLAVSDSLGKVERLAPAVSEKYKAQLKERVRELVDGKVDETRIMMEVGIFASKIDVSEEISRAGGHIRRFSAAIAAGGACGRELDFIVQEMGREVNTIGSKVPDYSVAEEVVSMKTNLDKIKEQVRNIE